MNLVVFGLGFSAKAFVDFAASQFSSITATVTSQEKAARLSRDTCHVVVFNDDYVDAKIESALAQADAVFISIGPDEKGDPVLRRFARHIEQSKTIRWIGYLSTIGVYGDAQGGWVDEATLPTPSHARTIMRVKVEQKWLALGERAAKPVQIFRLAGIYGPGRNPILNLVQRAQRIIKPGQVFNRIHVDDIAQLVYLVACNKSTGIVNAVSGQVVSFRQLAEFILEQNKSNGVINATIRSGKMPHNGYREFKTSTASKLFSGFEFKGWVEGLSDVHQIQSIEQSDHIDD
jgi:nucleoside-diphosphate-sugar epimerase